MGRREYYDVDFINEQVNSGVSLPEIAKKLGIQHSALHRWLDRNTERKVIYKYKPWKGKRKTPPPPQ
tara:strand:+ start:245 stop:445 length:201 start_codon:yes stop_codon:yes gene_type:complete